MSRIEYDSLGGVNIPDDKLWGAQTERSLFNFKIGSEKIPTEIIRDIAVIKKASALANCQLKKISLLKARLISKVCDEIVSGSLDEHFPLGVWQTGSGTHTNMNVNEVIVNRAHLISGGSLGDKEKVLHPNDDVNKSQSSNDVFPSAMHMSSYRILSENVLPNLLELIKTFQDKSKKYRKNLKVGRTHLMDAVPVSYGEEYSGYVAELNSAYESIKTASRKLLELPIGGTAVGTGLNTPRGFDKLAAGMIFKFTGYPFKAAKNKFESISSHGAVVQASSALRNLSVSLIKIGNDVRLAASGPRCGLNEISIPENEPGSSIMPGKVNPSQAEALIMVCFQVMGNDLSIALGGANGQFQLNVSKPLLIYNFLQSAKLLSDAIKSFNDKCVIGITPNMQTANRNLENSLMNVTALTNRIGYDRASKLAQKAREENKTLKQVVLESDIMTEKEFNELMKFR